MHGTNPHGLSLPALSTLVFMLVYNISFKAAEFASTGRVAIVLMLLCLLRLEPPRLPPLERWVYLLFLPVPYVLMQFVFVGDFGQLSRLVHLALYSFVGAWCAVRLAGSSQRFLLAFFSAAAVQSLFVLYSFVSLDYRAWYDAYVASGSNFDASYLYRATGLSSTTGSSLSVVQALGVLCGWLLLRSKALAGRHEQRWQALVLLGMLLMVGSCIVVGRTGLILSMLFLALAAANLPPRMLLWAMLLLLFSAYGVGRLFNLDALLPDDFSVEFFSQWAFGFLSGNDEVLETLNEMPIPPLSLETLLGTGLASLVDGANPSGHDSGFVQTYYAMGLPLTALLYSVYLLVLLHLMRWLPWHLRAPLALLFFSLEFKEPFLFKYIVMFVLLSLYHCHRQARTRLARG